MDVDEAYPTGNLKLYPCNICGRNFKQDSLAKHQNACLKLATKPKKIFDSGRQRATGSDVKYEKTKLTKKIQILGEKAESQEVPNHWREKHNDLIRSVKNARDATIAIKTGGPLPKFEPSAVPSDYVNCRFCARNFNKNAAERHIPFCELQNKRQKINNSASQKMKFQAPLPGQRKQSSEPRLSPSQQQQPQIEHQYSNGMGKGFQSGSMNRGFNSGNDRKPVKYDSNLYNDNDNQDYEVSSGAYSTKNKMLTANKAKQDQLLRTGRNTVNNELNTMARNRSGNNNKKDSPINSRDPSTKRFPAQAVAQNGPQRTTHTRAPPAPQNDFQPGTTKFCHECGTEYPVNWARFCSYCGDRRL